MSAYVGTLGLTRAALRRDRVLVPAWVAVLVVVVHASAVATADLYPTSADRVSAARAINASGAVVALYGPINDVHSLGELAMTKLTVLYALAVALLVLVLVRRHTRGDEESGHAELLGSTAIGRDAALGAALLETTSVALVVGAMAALVDVADGLPLLGSVAFGASWAGIGVVAAGLTALACQLSPSSRTCAGIAGGGLAALYAVRAVGDLGPGWVGWLSPFGWSTRLRAWHDPRWWVLLLDLALAAVLAVAAVALRHRRDLGAGVLATRAGPATGGPRLGGVVGLTWRLHRSALASWTAAVTALGLLCGAIAPGVGDLLDSDAGRRVLEAMGGTGALEDALLTAVLAVSAPVVTCFGVAVLAHAGNDEHDGRTEQVLATATSRGRSFLAALGLACAGSAWLMGVTGLATGVALGRDQGSLLLAGLVQVPATWVVISLAALLAALRSRWSALGWAVLGACVLVGQVSELLGLPGWVGGLTPYAHSPGLPSATFHALPEVVLTTLALVLVVTAWWRYGERDIG